jgi:hypothetical protein
MTSLDPVWSAYIGGFLSCAALVAAVFFLRFWRRAGESLFLSFAVAFVLMAINQALPPLMGFETEDYAGLFLLRLAAFGVIILAILRKNLAR